MKYTEEQKIINSFDYYFSAVKALKLNNGCSLVDYSLPKYHDLIDYDLHPIFFASFVEPLITTQQYLDFADLKEGNIVLDLGAYSGVTSISFDR